MLLGKRLARFFGVGVESLRKTYPTTFLCHFFPQKFHTKISYSLFTKLQVYKNTLYRNILESV